MTYPYKKDEIKVRVKARTVSSSAANVVTLLSLVVVVMALLVMGAGGM